MAFRFKVILLLICSFIIFLFFKLLINDKINFPDNKFVHILTNDEKSSVKSTKILNNVLVNYTDFHYIIRNQLCRNYDSDFDLLAVIIVTSYVGNDHVRSAHRQAISQEKLKSMGMLRIFMLGAIPEHEQFIEQEAVRQEHEKFGDIMQGNFKEAYRNLTYKHTMGLKWVAEECANTKFVIKVDDDTIFNIYEIQNYLVDLDHQDEDYLLAGYILNDKKPIRLKANKWYVSETEFSGDMYPPYLSGWLYITNPKTAHDLVVQTQRIPFFWIDDTYLTGIVANTLKIDLTRLNKWFSANADFLDCCIRDMEKHQLKCDYVVGPNGGDTKLIIKFMKESEKCFETECLQRTPDKALINTCVGQFKNFLGQHGNPIIKPLQIK